jgi:hypothetical protein
MYAPSAAASQAVPLAQQQQSSSMAAMPSHSHAPGAPGGTASDSQLSPPPRLPGTDNTSVHIAAQQHGPIPRMNMAIGDDGLMHNGSFIIAASVDHSTAGSLQGDDSAAHSDDDYLGDQIIRGDDDDDDDEEQTDDSSATDSSSSMLLDDGNSFTTSNEL